jgi:hypothetical protein
VGIVSQENRRAGMFTYFYLNWAKESRPGYLSVTIVIYYSGINQEFQETVLEVYL